MSNTEITVSTDLAPPFSVAGFRFAGGRCGIKHARPDLALVVSDRPTVVAGSFTKNKVRAACVERNVKMLPGSDLRAVLINSGNANAMTGRDGVEANERMAAAAASALGIPAQTVLTASTGSIGVPLPVKLIEEASGTFESKLQDDPSEFAKAILTTDTCTKVAHTELTLPGHDTPVRLLGVAKGSGMIHPNMATTFGFVMCDAAIAPATLQAMLGPIIDRTFNSITVDGDSSTNDMVLAMANGASGVHVEGDAAQAAFAEALEAVVLSLAKQVAADGEGATRLLTVEVAGAPSDDVARALARGVCRSSLVKCSTFAAQPKWGRVSMALGQIATDLGLELDPAALTISVQDTLLYDPSGPKLGNNNASLRARLQQTEVHWSVDVGMGGQGHSIAYGCDLSYDYVRINADESKQIEGSRSGSSRNPSLASYSPRLKHQLLVEGLSYVRRFVGMRALIYMPNLENLDAPLTSLANDLELCLDAGLKPLALLPTASAVESVAEHMRKSGRFAATVSSDAVSISNLLDRGHLCLMPRTSPAPDAIVDLALKLGIQKMIVLGPDGGLQDKHGLVQRLSPDTFLTGLERGRFDATDPELLVLARHAAKRGIPAFHAIDGRIPHAVVGELFTDEGIGTLMTRQALG